MVLTKKISSTIFFNRW